MENNVSADLFDLLVTRDFEPELLDSSGKSITDPVEADIISFDWKTNNHNYGTVVMLFGAENSLEVYYSDNLGRNMEPDDKRDWYDFLAQIKQFASRNLLSFNLQNINRLKYTMQGMAAIKEGLFESFRGTRRTSYRDGPKHTKLMIRHSRDLGENEARHHAIESLFIETGTGERFRVPSRSLMHGRMLERHVAEGGTPYDSFGQHITNMIQEMATLARFIRATKTRDLSAPAGAMVNEAVRHYHDLKAKARRMISQRGYQEAAAAFDPSEMPAQEALLDSIREMFTERHLDPRMESALPVLAKLQAQSMREADEFEAWTHNITEGIWTLPETPEQMDTLRNLMSEPLTVSADATNAQEQLYDVFGDDELFDQLSRLAQQDADADARPLVMARLRELGIDLDSIDSDVDEDLDTDGVMMTKPSNMSSESAKVDLARLRRLALI